MVVCRRVLGGSTRVVGGGMKENYLEEVQGGWVVGSGMKEGTWSTRREGG